LKQELGQNRSMHLGDSTLAPPHGRPPVRKAGRILAIAFVVLGVATIVATVVAVVWMARTEAANTTTAK
jgi:hypothetical protein